MAVTLTPIRTERDYKAALKRVSPLFDKPKLTREEQDLLEVYSVLIEAYERATYPWPKTATPSRVLRDVMEEKGLTAADLVPFIGSRNRVYDILNDKRELSKEMIVRLSRGLNIPADLLLPEVA